jgi:hypothetical protein
MDAGTPAPAPTGPRQHDLPADHSWKRLFADALLDKGPKVGRATGAVAIALGCCTCSSRHQHLCLHHTRAQGGHEFVDTDTALKGKHVGVYFSAHW